MLYLDSSALSKRYLQEVGSAELGVKLEHAEKAKIPVLTSLLTYAEIHAMLGRKLREGSLRTADHYLAATQFDSDWKTYFILVEIGQPVLSLVPKLIKRHPLRASDALQLASALWARQSARQRTKGKLAGRKMVFATADKQLAAAAGQERFQVFNPETP